jgi:hypothetical protein
MVFRKQVTLVFITLNLLSGISTLLAGITGPDVEDRDWDAHCSQPALELPPPILIPGNIRD